MKKNGFSRPFHYFQIFSWLAYLFNILTLSTVLTSMLKDDWSTMTLLSITYFITLSLGLLGFKLTSSNPQMKITPEHSSAHQNLEYFCSICAGFVSESSKHCSQCDKCIDGFDHHCFWLNNCIGRSNYRTFCFLLAFLELEMFFICFLDFLVIFRLGFDENFLVVIQLVFDFLIGVANGYLICFHVWLKVKKITTYEFILARRKKDLRRVFSDESPSSIGETGKTLPRFEMKIKEELSHRSLVHDRNENSLNDSEGQVNKTLQVYFHETELQGDNFQM